MEGGKVKEEPSSPASPKRKMKRAESPASKEQVSSPPLCLSQQAKCGGEGLEKTRRLLQSLSQHAEELGPSASEKVKSIIFALLGGTLSLDEFQASLVETTGSPLRPFVIPYLQAYLPNLQQEVAAQARLRKQGVTEYLSSCEGGLLEPGSAALPTSEVFLKRRIHERLYDEESMPSLKRPLLVPVHPMAISSDASDEQWRNIHVMLNCILSMVEKTKQALALLQHGARDSRHDEERISQSMRITEERIAQIRKKAEDAITDIRKKAQSEMEKATAGLNLATRSRTYHDLF